jgi:lipooligosaccharide transport system permease protein
VEEIILGEIVWGATKAVIATAIMMAVIGCFGLISWPEGLLLLPLAFLGGLAFGAVGMICTSVVPSIDLFNLPVFLFITPMFLFGGTFFPVENLPGWAQTVSACLPLTRLVDLSRAIANGRIDAGVLPSLIYLTAMIAATLPAALYKMRKRLIK